MAATEKTVYIKLLPKKDGELPKYIDAIWESLKRIKDELGKAGGANPYGESLKGAKELANTQAAIARGEKTVEQARRATIAADRELLKLERERNKLANETPKADKSNSYKVASYNAALKDIEKMRQDNARREKIVAAEISRTDTLLANNKAKEAKRGANAVIKELEQIKNESAKSAKGSGDAFTASLGGSFFGNLGANAVTFFIGKLSQLPGAVSQIIGEAVKLSEDKVNSLKGLESIAGFKGVDTAAAQEAVKSLRLVKAGIIDLSDGATGLKNLLASGFNLSQSIDILERFSDSAAFGKQAALGFGEAIRGGTEGIKNQNSVLVDNVGVTKNLSAILEERGFQLKDLSDKTKSQNALEALYKGLVEETNAQVGDADKLTQGYTGSVAGLDQAYKLLNTTVGDKITQSPALVAANKVQAEQIRQITELLNEQGTETQQTTNDFILMYAKIKAVTFPFLASIKNALLAAFASLSGGMAGLLGIFVGAGESLYGGAKYIAGSVINFFADAYNKIVEFARKIPVAAAGVVPGLSAIQNAPTIDSRIDTTFDFSISKQLFNGAANAAEASINFTKKLSKSIGEIDVALGDLNTYQQAIKKDLADAKRKSERDANAKQYGTFNEFGDYIKAPTGLKDKKEIAEFNRIARASNNSGKGGVLIPLIPDVAVSGSSAGSADKKAATDKLKETFMTWKDLKKIAEDLGFEVTSTTGGKHNDGSKHGKGLAIDIRTKDKSDDQIAWFMEEMRKAGVFIKDERTRPVGQKVWNGPHLHAEDGKLHGMGKGSKTDGFEKYLAEQSDAATKAEREKTLRQALYFYKQFGLIPTPELITEFQQLSAEEAKKTGDAQKTKAQILGEFVENAQSKLQPLPEYTGTVTSEIFTPYDQQKSEALKVYSDLLKELNERTDESAQSSEYNRVKKSLEAKEYEYLNEQQRQNLLLKANEIDAANVGKGLQEQIEYYQRGGRELTTYEETLKDLSGAYKNLSEAEQQNLLSKASQVDALRAARESYEQFRDIIGETVDAFFDGGFKGAFDSIKRMFKRFLSDLASEFLTSQFLKIFSGKSGGASSGGGIGSFLSGLFGGSGGSSGGGLSGLLGGLFGGRSSGGSSLATGAINAAGQFTVNGNQSTLLSQLGTLAPGVLPGTGGGATNSLSSLFSAQGISGALASGGLTAAVALAQYALTTTSPLKGLATGGLLGFLSGNLRRGAMRRKEEKQRTQFINDAFESLKQYDSLIKDVESLKIQPPESALETGSNIGKSVREAYLAAANGLTDKKTKGIAVKDVSRIDSIIAEKMSALKSAVLNAQNYGKDSAALGTAFFASGGFIKQYSDFKRRNGMLGGSWTGKDTLPSMLAQGEMVLNPYQINRVRANAGFDAFKNAGIPNYADGVSFASPAPAVSNKITVDFNPVLVINGASITDQFEAYFETEDGQRKVLKVVKRGKDFDIG